MLSKIELSIANNNNNNTRGKKVTEFPSLGKYFYQHHLFDYYFLIHNSSFIINISTLIVFAFYQKNFAYPRDNYWKTSLYFFQRILNMLEKYERLDSKKWSRFSWHKTMVTHIQIVPLNHKTHRLGKHTCTPTKI